jgi:glycerol kinase
MNINTLSWDSGICKEVGIPMESLPKITSSSENLGTVKSGPLAGVPITGCLGDQHAALLGHACLDVGDVKSTYGTGCFILMNTGQNAVPSRNGLLTTLGFKLGPDAPTTYALEGAVATAGRGIQWLRDSLKLIEAAPEIGPLAASVPDAGGVTFVPAFSGLLAPHWRPDARAALVGMSLHSTKAHICRAMLEGICFQACDVFGAMEMDATTKLSLLKVDGGLTVSDQAMQIQADLLGKPLLRAKMPEATALGAAFAAGLAVDVWKKPTDISAILERAGGADRFDARIDSQAREMAQKRWFDAVQRSLNLDGSSFTSSPPSAPICSPLGRFSLQAASARNLGRVLRKLR